MNISKIEICAILGTFVLFIACQSFSSISWFSWEEAALLAEKGDKKILVWVYDETCNSCKDAEQRNFHQTSISDYINTHFYPIKLEGHYSKPIITKGYTYKFVDTKDGGYHELAKAITQSQQEMSYPSLVFMDENMDLIIPVSGDINTKQLQLLLSFVAEDHFLDGTIEEYAQKIGQSNVVVNED